MATPVSEAVLAHCRESVERVYTLIPPDTDVLISIVGSDPLGLVRVLRDAEQIVASGHVGGCTNEQFGASVLVTKGFPLPLRVSRGATTGSVALAAGSASGKASAEVRFNEQGGVETRNVKRLQLFTLDSHGFSSVLNSFRDANLMNS